MFTRFGGISDTRVKAQIARGERIRALLSQPRFSSLRLADQVALLAALGAGLLDAVPAARLAELRARLPAQLDNQAQEAVAAIEKHGVLDKTLRSALAAAVTGLAQLISATPESQA
jgi:F-type H+-transporting ATPase subunit alpha